MILLTMGSCAVRWNTAPHKTARVTVFLLRFGFQSWSSGSGTGRLLRTPTRHMVSRDHDSPDDGILRGAPSNPRTPPPTKLLA